MIVGASVQVAFVRIMLRSEWLIHICKPSNVDRLSDAVAGHLCTGAGMVSLLQFPEFIASIHA